MKPMQSGFVLTEWKFADIRDIKLHTALVTDPQ